jgi:hypothetical protein
MLDAEDLPAGTPTFPTDNTINDESLWLDESLKISTEARLAMQNDVSAFEPPLFSFPTRLMQ